MANYSDAYRSAIHELIMEEELKDAIELLRKLSEPIGGDTHNAVIMNAGKFNKNEKDYHLQGIIRREDYDLQRNRVKAALLHILDDIPKQLRLKAMKDKLLDTTPAQLEVPAEGQLEKILGSKSGLMRIQWLEQALNKARAVCHIRLADGSMGTGFLTEGNYLFTNHHVIPSPDKAASASIEFNRKQDGTHNPNMVYSLDASDFATSPVAALDFTRVKVKENGQIPLSEWGYLRLQTGTPPAVGENVTIVQHPRGGVMQIAFSRDGVLGQRGDKIYYDADTEAGSSGSPVFNAQWEVVALHHAGKDNLQINEAGARANANVGILFGAIVAQLGGQASSSGPIEADPESAHKPTHGAGKPSVFLLYDGANAAFAAELYKQLKVLRSLRLFDMHKDLSFGDDEASTYAREMGAAKFVLCLLSADLLANDDLYTLMENGKAQGCRLVPILLEDVNYEQSPLFGLASLPPHRRFIAPLPPAEQTKAFADIARIVGEEAKKA